jgi:RES domain-containing protein
VAVPAGWDAASAVAACPIIPWHGDVWRAHLRRYGPADYGGALRFSGRYHRGPDLFPPDQTWPALYTSLEWGICLGEVMRHLSTKDLANLANYSLSQISVTLEAVLDCRQPALMGLTADDICEDLDYTVPQSIAAAAITRGSEGLLVPSATRLGDNLILFPKHYRAGSRVTAVHTIDPRLYVPRS